MWQSIITQLLFLLAEQKYSYAKVNKNKNRFEINLGVTSFCKVTMRFSNRELNIKFQLVQMFLRQANFRNTKSDFRTGEPFYKIRLSNVDDEAHNFILSYL